MPTEYKLAQDSIKCDAAELRCQLLDLAEFQWSQDPAVSPVGMTSRRAGSLCPASSCDGPDESESQMRDPVNREKLTTAAAPAATAANTSDSRVPLWEKIPNISATIAAPIV